MKLLIELVIVAIVAVGFSEGVIYGLDKQAESDQIMISKWLGE